MKKYKVVFYLNGKRMETEISANGYSQAKQMIQAMYPGVTGATISITEIR